MKSTLAALALLLFCYATCTKESTAEDVAAPACIQQKIDEIKSQQKWNPPAQVNEYLYNGKKVFHFSSNCCDQYDAVYDENCNYICAPSGGITGKGDGKCSEFFSSAQHVRLVWKDNR